MKGLALGLGFIVAALGCGQWESEGGGPGDDDVSGNDCTHGTDLDGDGYGEDCPLGEDCDDSDPFVNPGQAEHCDGADNNCDGQVDEGVLNDCGTCDPGCLSLGATPFPTSDGDPNAQEDGCGLDENGDLVLDQTEVEYSFLWIANTDDLGVGTVSKIDGDTVAEVGRYLTVTCGSEPATPECDDINGAEVQQLSNYPSRTAVDFNFDVWVANRAFYDGQPSVTKIASAPADCIDRNGNGVIDTSTDHDGDLTILTDCDNDGYFDSGATACDNGNPPEFLGLDDECVLFTVNYGGIDEIGRSVCLDAGTLSPDGVYIGPGNAWVCTNNRMPNQCFQLSGETGELLATVELPSNSLPYGCAVDGEGILWASGGWSSANLTWVDSTDPAGVGAHTVAPPQAPAHLYGVAVDEDDNIWLAGWDSQTVYRYEPDRSSVMTLLDGTWSQVTLNNGATAGLAADNRGYVWVAENDAGYIYRVDPSLVPSGGEYTVTGTDRWGPFGETLRGVGVDFRGNVWGVSYIENRASRMEVDSNGDVINPNAGEVFVGEHPYTYSDFTGYGLRIFTNPHGWWSYLIEGCGEGTYWHEVEWTGYEPAGTDVLFTARSGATPHQLGDYTGTYDTSPADLNQSPGGPIDPNPASYLEIRFEMYSDGQENTPSLSSVNVTWSCP